MTSACCVIFAIDSRESLLPLAGKHEERVLYALRITGLHDAFVQRRPLMFQNILISLFMMAVTGVMFVGVVSEASGQAIQVTPNRGLAAIDRAAKANRHLFIFFYRQDDAQTQALGTVFNGAVAATGGRVDSIAIAITDPAEAGIVTKFGAKDAPMPLAVVLAPSGAVTGSFPSNFTKEQLLGGIATPLMEKLLGALQQGKLVILCVQNGRTRGNAEAMNGVRAFTADQRYAAATDVIMLDPSLPTERPFLAKLGMNAPVDEAMTLFVAPPGSIIGSFKGATDKNQLIATLTNAVKGCGTGCQPGQCGVGN